MSELPIDDGPKFPLPNITTQSPERILRNPRNTELQKESHKASPGRNQQKEVNRLLEQWQLFDHTIKDCKVTFEVDSTLPNDQMQISLLKDTKELHAAYGNAEFIQSLQDTQIVCVPSYSRHNCTSLLDDNFRSPDNKFMLVIVVEEDQLEDYRGVFQNEPVLWIVLPKGVHRGVLVSRQIIHLCIRGMKEENLINQEMYFQLDDDVRAMEIRKYEKNSQDKYVYPKNILTFEGCLDYVLTILDPTEVIETLRKNKLEEFMDFHDTWIEIGCTPSRNLKGKDQYANMEKFELGRSARVSGFMAMHIERSRNILFCPMEWLWYDNETWKKLQCDRMELCSDGKMTDNAKMIQLIYFQGEDFRACALTAENIAGKKYLNSYILKRLVFNFGSLPSVARTINPKKKKESDLVERFNRLNVQQE